MWSPSPKVDNTSPAPTSPITPAPAGVASQYGLPLSSRRAGSCSTRYRLPWLPAGSGRHLFGKEFSLTPWTRWVVEDCLRSPLSSPRPAWSRCRTEDFF